MSKEHKKEILRIEKNIQKKKVREREMEKQEDMETGKQENRRSGPNEETTR